MFWRIVLTILRVILELAKVPFIVAWMVVKEFLINMGDAEEPAENYCKSTLPDESQGLKESLFALKVNTKHGPDLPGFPFGKDK